MLPALLQAPAQFFDLAQSAVLFAASLAAALLARHLILRTFDRWAQDRSSPANVLLDSLRWPSMFWCLATALVITLEYADLPSRAAKWARGGSVVFLVLSICVVTSSLLVRLVVFAGQKRGFSVQLSGVSRALIHVFVMLLGLTVLFRYFDIAVAPILTALGVGGLAVALALRDTLANFFAGIHILVEAPVSVGEFIRLSSGEEGTVTDIGWRTTRVHTTDNNTVVIPNERITSSILTNFALPDQRMMTSVVVFTDFGVDIDQIEASLAEEAAQVEGIEPGFAPVVLFDPGATPTHLGFKVVVQVPNRLAVGLTQSRLRERIYRRFQKDGVPMPEIAQRGS
ncbi:MAG: mechanosensitive ion channel [Bryobacterales bacterium]|nr:mechanosensitive ion channel [Bryobacterales bacterium]